MTDRNKPTVTFSFNKELIHEIDKRRGQIPRSLYVEQTLTDVFTGSKVLANAEAEAANN